MKKLHIKMDEKRLGKMKVGTYRKASGGDIEALCTFTSEFLWNPDKSEYYPKVEALGIVDDLTFDELKALMAASQQEAKDVVVPPGNGTVSEQP